MKIFLLKDVPNLGKAGDIRDVKDGYGRNFLIRRKLAQIATFQLEKQSIIQKERDEKDTIELKQKVAILKEKLEKTKIIFKAKAGKSGKTFGSITVSKILSELKKRGIGLEKEQIVAIGPIKTLGEKKVKIKLPYGTESEITVLIEKEDVKQR